MTRIALFQATTGIDPAANADALVRAAIDAAEGGAAMLFTPEMSNLLDRDRARAGQHVRSQHEDATLARMCETAERTGLWIALGSFAFANKDGSRANRAIVIDPAGEIRSTYDKMHMFDVDLDSGESWRESNVYRAGDRLGLVNDTPLGRLGLAICYDIRFPALFDALGQAQCDAIAIPAAFTVPTGTAHWHILQRARAIEASAFVVSAAQVGEHEDGRRTYGHSLVIDPWGEVLLDMGGERSGVGFADIDRVRIAQVRAQVPSLANRRPVSV